MYQFTLSHVGDADFMFLSTAVNLSPAINISGFFTTRPALSLSIQRCVEYLWISGPNINPCPVLTALVLHNSFQSEQFGLAIFKVCNKAIYKLFLFSEVNLLL